MGNRRFFLTVIVLFAVALSVLLYLQVGLVLEMKSKKYIVEFYDLRNPLQIDVGEDSYYLDPGDQMKIELRETGSLKVTQTPGGSYRLKKGENLYLVKVPVVEVKIGNGKN